MSIEITNKFHIALARPTKKKHREQKLSVSGTKEYPSPQILQTVKNNLNNFKELFSNKLDNLEEIDKFPERHKLPKLYQEGNKQSE